jgi:hypothetical protein
MSDLTALTAEIDALQAVQAELAEIANRTDQARRSALVELRRKLSAQIGQVGSVADPIFNGLDDHDLVETYRAKFSKMRSAAAGHQANWPAVMLGERPDEYQASAQLVREANRDFIAWMRETIEQLRGRTPRR